MNYFCLWQNASQVYFLFLNSFPPPPLDLIRFVRVGVEGWRGRDVGRLSGWSSRCVLTRKAVVTKLLFLFAAVAAVAGAVCESSIGILITIRGWTTDGVGICCRRFFSSFFVSHKKRCVLQCRHMTWERTTWSFSRFWYLYVTRSLVFFQDGNKVDFNPNLLASNNFKVSSIRSVC